MEKGYTMNRKPEPETLDYVILHHNNREVVEDRNQIEEEKERNTEPPIEEPGTRGRQREDTNEVLREMNSRMREENERELRNQGVRRSSRERRPTKWFISNMSREDVSRTYDDAMQSKERDKWSEAIKNELKTLKSYEVWKAVEEPNNEKIIRSKWVFMKKRNNEEIRYKARLVAGVQATDRQRLRKFIQPSHAKGISTYTIGNSGD